MNYAITYCNIKTNEQHTIEWFVPRLWGWTEEQVKDSFEFRYPNVNVTGIKVLQCC